jgi:general secretion pathway protein K
MRRARGAALLLVLWLMVLLIALVGAFSMAARTEGLQAHALVDGVQAEQAARAGLEYAMTRVARPDPRQQWRPDGRPYHWRFADADVEVRIVDEDGKVDLNHAETPLLTGLMVAVGIERPRAEKLAGAVMDWRDPDPMTQPSGGGEDADYSAADRPYGAKDADFESPAELLQVLGFKADDYRRLAPYVTVFSGRVMPEAAYAGAPVLTAMGMDGAALVQRREGWDPSRGQALPGVPGGETLQAFGSGTYSIESRARLSGGRTATLGAVVRTGGSAIPGMAYTPLRWEEGIPSP